MLASKYPNHLYTNSGSILYAAVRLYRILSLPPPPLLLLALTTTGNKSLGSEAAQNPRQHLIIH